MTLQDLIAEAQKDTFDEPTYMEPLMRWNDVKRHLLRVAEEIKKAIPEAKEYSTPEKHINRPQHAVIDGFNACRTEALEKMEEFISGKGGGE